jgi:diamine N-acetyltransferase
MKAERITRTDRSGKPFEIGIGCPEDFALLLQMYRAFSPKPASQGLPPEDPETCRDWVKTLLGIGENLLAWNEGGVVAHVAVIPDAKGRSGELVIFVHQDHRNLGVGTELMRFTLEKFGHLGFDSVWLTVSLSNFIAIKLYRRLGFEFCDRDNCERMMSVKLRSGNEQHRGA